VYVHTHTYPIVPTSQYLLLLLRFQFFPLRLPLLYLLIEAGLELWGLDLYINIYI
jgi:hypothetical protein